jgi:hypothetical protein
MTGAMQTISDALPSGITAISDPLGSRLAVLAAWAAAALVATGWLVRRTGA